ncbi:MAG: hypothetical protein EBQ94_00140, partial [Flavobacteriales bacterium]|nr:hypothetical protein [Flavobacteriales bacterium]
KRITHKIINLFLTIFILIALAAIWNIQREQLIVFMTSVVTVLGIAFFAQWSILSNITASLILFFNHPLKIGHQVRVMDKEYDIEGELIDISFFFHVHTRQKQQNDYNSNFRCFTKNNHYRRLAFNIIKQYYLTCGEIKNPKY